METNLNKRFRTRKEQQLANKFRKYGAAKALAQSWNNLCDSCRITMAKQVENGKPIDRKLFCPKCEEAYIQNMKDIVEKEFGGELYDGDKRIE